MKNLIRFILLCIFYASLAVGALPLKDYHSKFYSPTGVEALLQFQSSVLMTAFERPTPAEAVFQIEKQVAFLFGSFANQSQRSVPKGDHQFKVLNFANKGGNLWQVDYQYQGVIQTEAKGNLLVFELPTNPDDTYRKSLVTSSGRTTYPCGDLSHPQAEYFWYFFNPHGYGCPLKEGIDYIKGQGSLKFLASTKISYPEYSRLVYKGELAVHVLFGMDNSSLSRNPVNSRDINARSYLSLRNYLLRNGYQIHTWSHEEMVTFFKGRSFDFPYVEEFSKTSDRGINLKVRLFFGPTSNYDGFAFHHFWQDALAHASMTIYAGHSGLGDYLDPRKISQLSDIRLEMPLDRYQILFFNGCSSYPYYNKNYFSMKRSAQDPAGTKNLDIITNGLATLFMAITPSTSVIFNAIEQYVFTGQRISYQQMLDRADSQNLMGINGDEDNVP